MGLSPFFFRSLKMLNRGLDKLELLRIVEAVANEKSIDKELVIGSMESAIQKAALIKFGSDNNIEVIINRENGEIKIGEFPETQIWMPSRRPKSYYCKKEEEEVPVLREPRLAQGRYREYDDDDDPRMKGLS